MSWVICLGFMILEVFLIRVMFRMWFVLSFRYYLLVYCLLESGLVFDWLFDYLRVRNVDAFRVWIVLLYNCFNGCCAAMVLLVYF